jgi:hypothetical protein
MLVNCWGKSSLTSLAEAISEAFLASQSRRDLSLKTILSGFTQMRPQATIDPQTGHPTFSVDLASSREFTPRSLERVLEPIGEDGKKRPLVVVLDEFQALLQLTEHKEVMATLRGAIQLQPAVTYFYLGSIRNQMDAILNDPKQPIFKSAASVSVGPIARKTYAIYLRKKFAAGRRDIEDAALERVFELANDITSDVQQLCSQIWNITLGVSGFQGLSVFQPVFSHLATFRWT